MTPPIHDQDPENAGGEAGPADEQPRAGGDVFTRWGSGALLLFTVGSLLLYEIWVVVLWIGDSPLGAWGLALAPLLGVVLPVAFVIRPTRIPVREQLWLYGLSGAQVIGVLLASIGAVPVCYAAGALNATWWPPDPEYFELFGELAPTGLVSLLGGFMAVVVCVPLGEEILFRFLVLGVLARHVHAVVAAVAAGVLFAAAHGALFVLLPITVLGIVLGLLTVWSRTLTAAWIGHAVFNLFGYVELCISGDPATPVVEGFALNPIVLVTGTVMLVGGLALLRADAMASLRRDVEQPARADSPPQERHDADTSGHSDA